MKSQPTEKITAKYPSPSTTNGNPQPLILNPPPKQHYTPLKLQNQPKNHNLFKLTTHSNPSLKIDSIHGGKLRRSKATTHSKRTPMSKSHNRQQQTQASKRSSSNFAIVVVAFKIYQRLCRIQALPSPPFPSSSATIAIIFKLCHCL